MTPRLSVLICTIPSRGPQLSGLVYHLNHQSEGKPVELLYLGDNKRMTVGEKRNKLMSMAVGDYVAFCDDDDRISSSYISWILAAAEHGSDCIVFQEGISENGAPAKPVIFDKDFECNRNFPDHYERWPHHRMPVRRPLALQVPFPLVSTGEDFAYAKGLHGLLKTQTRIDETLYFYDYNSDTSETPR